jgi:class 3 adenylate cyclase
MEIDLAILFADVCDSTRLYETVGNVRATQIIQGILRQLESVVIKGGGRVVKSLGDGLMCTFPDPTKACTTAETVMATVASASAVAAQVGGVHVRVGLHYGSAVDADGDVFGDAVNVAARVQGLASPQEILLTDEMVRRVPDLFQKRAMLLDTTAVKGKTIPIGIYRLRRHDNIEDSIDSTVIGLSAFRSVKEAALTLKLVYLDREVMVDHGHPKVTIGRSESCDIMILSRQASRQHGAIEFSRESFMLTDHSSNGTFIRTGNEPPIVVRRDSTRLVGSGRLGIGAVPERDGDDHVIRFVCDLDV